MNSPLTTTKDLWPVSPTAMDTSAHGSALDSLVFATGNKGKLAEIAAVLGVSPDKLRGEKIAELFEPQPSSDVLDLMARGDYVAASQSIAGTKALHAWRVAKSGRCVEDTGLYIEALGGRPGPEIKSWDSPALHSVLCEATRNHGNLRAVMVVSFGFYPGFGEPQTRSAALEGEIARSPRGTQGFGFDRIFIPSPEQQQALFPGKPIRTFAEMDPAEKAALNPRVKALTAIAQAPFKFASNPPRVLIPNDAARVAIRDIKTEVPKEHKERVLAAATRIVGERRAAIKAGLNSAEGVKNLVHTGELPERVLDDHTPAVRAYMQPFDMGRLRIVSRDTGGMAIAHSAMRMELLNHPFVLEGMLRTQQAGFVPVAGKSIRVVDSAINAGRATTYEDYKMGARGATSSDTNNERIISIMVGGLGSWTSTRLVTQPILGASVPSMISAWSLAEGALCGIPSFTPCDSYWSDHKAQITMLQQALKFVEQHPFIHTGRWNSVTLSNGQTVKDFVLERAKRLIGATLKARPETIVEVARQFQELGVSSFRVYEAGSTRTLQAAVAELAKANTEDPNIIIYAGQVGGIEQARQCVEAGAHALIVGIGDGALCSTADVAALAGRNPETIYELVSQGIGIPVIADGGVGGRAPVAHALGASGRMMAGSLSGGTISLRLVKLSNGEDEVYDPEYGEASSPTKHRGGQVDALGEAMGVEGIAARRLVDRLRPTLPSRAFASLYGIAKALRFELLDTLPALIHHPNPDVTMPTGAALRAGSPHHDHPESKDIPRPFTFNFEQLS